MLLVSHKMAYQSIVLACVQWKTPADVTLWAHNAKNGGVGDIYQATAVQHQCTFSDDRLFINLS